MQIMRPRIARLIYSGISIGGFIVMLCTSHVAMASCRVTDFATKPLSSINEVEQLSFASQMTQTEFDKLHALPPGSDNYIPLVAASQNVVDARHAAASKLAGLRMDNVDDYRKIWVSDFLTDDQLRRYADCTSQRQPGLTVVGRSENPSEFHLVFTHITPIGVEKITTRVVASYNIVNIKELEALLSRLGPQDNYNAQSFALKLENPGKPAVLVMQAGWETPKFIYIPSYPTPKYFN